MGKDVCKFIYCFAAQAMGRRGVRSKYVDVLNPAGNSVGGASTQAPPPSMALPPMMSGGAPPSFFVPQQPPTTSGMSVLLQLKSAIYTDIQTVNMCIRVRSI